MDTLAYWVVGFLALAFLGWQIKVNALAAARRAYRNALAELERHPHSPDHKKAALYLGRKYSSLSRDSKGHTLFDEVALMNDISAATAAAGSPSSAKTTASPEEGDTSRTVEQRLETLESLRTRGLISQQEFEEKRRSLIAEL